MIPAARRMTGTQSGSVISVTRMAPSRKRAMSSGWRIRQAAALATQEVFGQQDWMLHNRNVGHLLWMSVAGLLKHPNVAEVRQQGMILAIELAQDARQRVPFPREQRRGLRVYRHGLEKGVLLRPLGDVVYFMPPYTIAPEDVKLLAQTTLEALDLAVQ